MRAVLSALAPALCAGAVALTGCAVVDRYSERAVVYNVQAEQAQNEALLLNIVRASMRRPMQFTSISSITGTAIASAGTGYTLPTNVPFRPATNGTSIAQFPPVPTWNFAGSMSGGPAFTVPVLDTQEFYQGILKPIPGQLYDLYIQAGYPPDLLFNLFVKKITMTRADEDDDRSDSYCARDSHHPDCELVFDNYPSNELEIRLFQAIADYLLALGLTTEAAKPVTVDFKNANNINVRYVGAPSNRQDKDLVQVVAPPGGSATSTSEPAPKEYGFCFRPRENKDADCVGGPFSPEVCGENKSFYINTDKGRLKYNEYLTTPLHCDGQQRYGPPVKISEFFPKFPPCFPNVSKGPKCEHYQPPITSDDRSEKTLSPADHTKTQDDAKLQLSGASKVKVIVSGTLVTTLRNLIEGEDRAQERRFHNEQQPGTADYEMKLHELQKIRSDFEKMKRNLDHFYNQPTFLTLTLRSTEGMIYYVGELARRQLEPEFNAAGPVYVKVGSPIAGYPREPLCTAEKVLNEPNGGCKVLFLVGKDIPPPNTFVSVYYSGRDYWVPSGSYAEVGLSSQVLDILRQQIAVNSSAKSLPQSSVISLVGGQ
jgi:hypothetical protein